MGGHLLAGIALGAVSLSAMTLLAPLTFRGIFSPQLPWSNSGLASVCFWLLIEAISGALGVSLILNLISVPIQRRWLAAVIFVLVMTLVLIPSYDRPSLMTTARMVIWNALLAFTLIRFGVLATVASLYTAFMIEDLPLTRTGLPRTRQPPYSASPYWLHWHCTGS